MRNLALVDRKSVDCELLRECVAATIEKNILYFATKNELGKLNLDSPHGDEHMEVLVPLEDGTLLDLKYLPEEDTLAMVTDSGCISTYDQTSSSLDVVGDVAGGIAAACWSPDMETLAILSQTGNLLIMSRMWDMIEEIPLFQEDFGEAKFVSVGWGSKETQFHGSEGKNARSQRTIQSTLADWDDRSPRIVWRADGLFFAVNAVERDCDRRTIRVFNREGQLQSTSEPVEQLEQSLSWKSSGASGLITSTVTLTGQGKRQVAFFEKNGLRHGEFQISSASKVLETFWNGDSTVLAILLCNEEGDHCVQLWTISNYHWHMKHCIPFRKGSQPLWLAWDVIETNRLHLVAASGKYMTMDYQGAVTHSRGLTKCDPTCVAVVDNLKLKLTFLREAVIPPPMCGWEIEFADMVLSVDVMSSDSSRLCVVTHGGLIHFFRFAAADEADRAESTAFKIIRKEGKSVRPIWTSSLKLDVTDFVRLYHWRWVNDLTMVACDEDRLLVLGLDGPSVNIRETVRMENRIGALVASREQSKTVFAHLVNGKTVQLQTDAMSVSEFGSCAEFCSQLDVVGDHVIGLAASGRLYVDGRETLSTVSSFAVHSDFLLMTSLQKHQLLCLPLARLSSPVIPTERAIERGAKLVHAVAESTTVVLQMPRGNLEAIHPRTLSLNIVKSLIDRHCYGESFELMKKQRINLNLFYDHRPVDFLAHCDEFVRQISPKDVTNLNLFLGELQNEDFATTMYQSHYPEKSNAPAVADKVNTVCTRLREAMNAMDPAKYLLPILTSLIRQGMLDSALKRVQSLEEESTKDRALKYMAVLVDGDNLYKEALATYDLQLTLMVAHRSQKDPKEYLPFLNDLHSMKDEYDRRFTIDNTLKRYDSAVRQLCRCRPVRTDQIVGYIKLHRVYAPVVDELCGVGEEGRVALQTAACLLAETLTARDNHEEAGYLYQRAELHQQALDCFQRCGLWQNCLALAAVLQMSEADVANLVTKLVTSLRASKKYCDAAYLAEHHLKDYQLSCQCFIDGWYFSDAWSLVHRYGMKQWAENTLKGELMEAFNTMHSKLDHLESECCKYVARLLVVRQDLIHKLDHPPAETDHGDLYSETGSSIFTHTTGTGTSGRTFRSSKNKRKHERKKLRLKEGSPFEDLALIHELHVLYLSTNSVLGDVGRLLRGELLINKDWGRAKLLQARAEAFIQLLEAKKKDVWNFGLVVKNHNNDSNYGPSATTEMIISQVSRDKEEYFSVRYLELDPKVRNPPDSPDTAWKMDGLK